MTDPRSTIVWEMSVFFGLPVLGDGAEHPAVFYFYARALGVATLTFVAALATTLLRAGAQKAIVLTSFFYLGQFLLHAAMSQLPDEAEGSLGAAVHSKGVANLAFPAAVSTLFAIANTFWRGERAVKSHQS